MTDETATYARELRWILDQIAEVIAAYPADRLNWRPATGSANGAGAIVTHVLSCTRVYVLGFGCGQGVTRDRQEFLARDTSADELISATRLLAAEIESALVALEPRALDRRLLPSAELFGEVTRPREISARDAIVESIRHAAIHLGELRLTHDLAGRRME